jgi:cysteine desulfurase family protein (TIGR01976 family)
MTLDLKFVRSQFPGLSSEWTFFDNAGGSQILNGVVDGITKFLLNTNVQTGGSYELSGKASIAVQHGRQAIATMMNAPRAEEVILGSSTTVLIQNLAKAMNSQFNPGDEVIVTNTDHESNIGPWVGLASQGVVIKFWEVNPETYELDLQKLDELITNKTKLVCFTHASNVLGTVNPVKEITKLVHSYGAKVCVDGVAYAPHRLIDVVDWDVDYYVFSLYKTYGPHYAAMYGKYELLLQLDNIYHYFFSADKVPYKLEPGNVNYELVYGSASIVDYLVALGSESASKGNDRDKIVAAFEDICEQEKKLGEHLLTYLRGRQDCKIIGLNDGLDLRRVPTISFIVDGQDPQELAKKMDEHYVAVRFGDFYARRLIEFLGLADNNGVLRVSMTHYNTISEVDKLITALELILPKY